MSTPRQTASFLMRQFSQAGLRPDTRKGQNFLIDLNLLAILSDEAQLGPSDVVLEIGTGLGSLTARMAPSVAAVVTVEVDPHVQRLAYEQLSTFSNVTLLHQDALKNKNHLHPEVLAAVEAALARVPGGQLKLVSNLPYNIATPVISNLLSTEITPVSMTVTIQKELADRLMAVPSTKDYSALSIWVQSQCDVRLLRIMPPEVFWPRPKVTSAIVQVVPNADKKTRLIDPEFFHAFVRSMFFHRRKLLRSELISAFKEQLDKPAVDRLLEEMSLSGNARAEELTVEQMLELARRARSAAAAAGAQ